MTSALDACQIKVNDGVTVVTLLSEFDYDMGLEVIEYLSEHHLYEYRIIDYNGFSWHIKHDDILKMTEFSKSLFPKRNFVAFTVNDDLAFGETLTAR